MAYNFSFHFLLAFYMLAQLSTIRIAVTRLGYLDNVQPREALDRMEKLGKWDKAVIKRLRRRQAAHENAFEQLAIYAAGVVAGNYVGLSTGFMNTLTGTFFLLRLAYFFLYVNITDGHLSLIRTVVWWTANIEIIVLLWKCGSALNA